MKLEDKVSELTERLSKHQDENKEAIRILCESISQQRNLNTSVPP